MPRSETAHDRRLHEIRQISQMRQKDYLTQSLSAHVLEMAGPLLIGPKLLDEIRRLTGVAPSADVLRFRCERGEMPVLRIGRHWACFAGDVPLIAEALGLQRLPGVSKTETTAEAIAA
jgi:hypothetical protein